MERFKYLYENWNGNPYFYYNYATVLRDNLDYKLSNDIIEKYNNFHIDYDSMITKANNYYDLEDFDNAIKYYNQSHWMCPNRFVPLQGLMRTYKAMGNYYASTEIAKEIKTKKIKKKSYKVSLIKMEAENLLKYEYKNY